MTRESYVIAVSKADLSDAAEFSYLLNEGFSRSGLSVSDIATEFSASLTSVNRWLDGEAAPSPPVRLMVLLFVSEHIKV